AQVRYASYLVEPNHGERDGASDQDQGLNGIGIDDRGQAAGDRVDASGDDQHNRGFHQRPSGNSLQHHARRVELTRDLGEDVSDDRDRREVHRTVPAESALQELRHREHVAAQVERYEHPAENQQNQASQPFKVSNGEARRSARAGKSNEMFGRDIRYEQRRADKEPAYIAAGEEIVGGGALLAGEVQANAENNQE